LCKKYDNTLNLNGFVMKVFISNIHTNYNKTKKKLNFISDIFRVQRQGRLAPSGPVQTHRSNVAYTSSSGVRSPQGPIRSGPRPPAPPTPDEGPLPPAPPLDVTGKFFFSFLICHSCFSAQQKHPHHQLSCSKKKNHVSSKTLFFSKVPS
jgi:hypothetical protein